MKTQLRNLKKSRYVHNQKVQKKDVNPVQYKLKKTNLKNTQNTKYQSEEYPESKSAISNDNQRSEIKWKRIKRNVSFGVLIRNWGKNLRRLVSHGVAGVGKPPSLEC